MRDAPIVCSVRATRAISRLTNWPEVQAPADIVYPSELGIIDLPLPNWRGLLSPDRMGPPWALICRQRKYCHSPPESQNPWKSKPRTAFPPGAADRQGGCSE